jgi:hypothetical protein
MDVDGGVEVGVVIHLELAVELEAAAAGKGLLPELVEAGGEVVALLAQQVETGKVALAMGLGGGGAMGLLGGVVELEGEDGEAVEDEAGGFGVERRGGVLHSGCGEESAVEGFDQVVAFLVECIDGALEAGDAGVRGTGLADLVFFVPEIEVGAVMGEGEFNHVRGRRGGFGGRGSERGRRCEVLVPAERGLVLQSRDLESGQHGR